MRNGATDTGDLGKSQKGTRPGYAPITPSRVPPENEKIRTRRRKTPLPAKCFKCRDSVGMVNLVSNLLLVVTKAYLGIVGGSKALFADAIHSLADLVASIMMIVALKISGKPKDESYQYGRGKAEFVVAVLIYATLILVGIFIFVDAVRAIYSGQHTVPHVVTAWGALISVLINEVMHGQGMCVSGRFNSPSIKARAMESRVDVYSSLAVLVGIVFARFGMPYLDSAAAIFVAMLILHSGYEELVNSISSLMDKSLDDEQVVAIKDELMRHSKVKKLGNLRTREAGATPEIDLTVYVDKKIKVQAFGKLQAELLERINSQMDFNADVTIQLRPFEGRRS